MMNLNQTKLVGLTMELDLKAREYKKLCNKLQKLKQENTNCNNEKLLELKQLFHNNYDEIVRINKQISKIKEREELIEKQKLEKFDTSNLFKRNNNIYKNNKEENISIAVVETKINIFQRLIKRVRQIFIRNSK